MELQCSGSKFCGGVQGSTSTLVDSLLSHANHSHGFFEDPSGLRPRFKTSTGCNEDMITYMYFNGIEMSTRLPKLEEEAEPLILEKPVCCFFLPSFVAVPRGLRFATTGSSQVAAWVAGWDLGMTRK